MEVVEIGQWESPNEEFRHQSLLVYLYSIYSKHTLQRNNFETFIGPLHEHNVLELALFNLKIDEKFSFNELTTLWIEVSKQRLFNPKMGECELVRAVEDVLTTCNIADRVRLLLAIKEEYGDNLSLVQDLHSTEFVVVSNQLTWFEVIVVKLLIAIGVPKLRFASMPDLKPLHALQLCYPYSELFKDTDPISRALLSYLAVAVNIQSSIDLAMIINKPFRGFGKSFLALLRRVAASYSLLPGQLVLSYPVCMTESEATSTLDSADAFRLQPHASALTHLADTIRRCQDALSGYVDDDDASLASSSQFHRMSGDAAAAAVCACLLAAQRAFAKPLRGIHNPPDKPAWDLRRIKEVREELSAEVQELASSPLVAEATSLFESTPNRATSSGGSLQGRAAFRLARFFLVFEAAGQVAPPPPLASASHQTSVTPSSNPTQTPIGHRTLTAFFKTPGSAERTPQPVEKMETEGNSDGEATPIADRCPTKPLHARYQSNLEWAMPTDNSPSPVVRQRHSVGENPDAAFKDKGGGSIPTSGITTKKARLQFEEGAADAEKENPPEESMREAVKPAPSKAHKGKAPSKSGKRRSEPKTTPNQPSILSFMKPKPNQ